MIIKLERESHIPLYLQIVQQVKALIAEGVLKAGDKLLPTRELANELHVHRNTVYSAYDELIADGFIISHIGRGTFVAESAPVFEKFSSNINQSVPSFTPMLWDALFVNEARENSLQHLLPNGFSDDVISFALAHPIPEIFPFNQIKRSVDNVLRRDKRVILQFGESAGYFPLREALVSKMASFGIKSKVDEIIITNGCQQSLALIRQVLVGSGDAVLIENPTFPGALSVFDTQDVRCLSIPFNEDGINLTALEEMLSRHRVKLIYVTPTFHNPTGSTMDLVKRRRLLNLSVKYGVPIVEDDIYSDLRFEGEPMPPLKALDENGSVIYLSSFSKMGFPGLRVGWIAAPKVVVSRLNTAKQTADLHTNTLGQAILCELLQTGLMNKFLKRSRAEYAERCDRMIRALERYFPDSAKWNHPEGGMSVWVTLPKQIDASNLLSLAMQEGVIFSPGSRFYLSLPLANTMRLTFTVEDLEKIDEGIKRLGNILKKMLTKAKSQRLTYEPTRRAVLV